MATAGPNSPGTMADDATVGTATWINVNNAIASDDVRSQVSIRNTTSHYLKATNFGFAIPSGATINGITVEIEERRSGTAVIESTIKIVKSTGAFGSTNKSTGATLPASDTYITYGGAADTWGETWTDTDINSANFGVGFSARETSGTISTAQVDHIRITIDYTPAASGAKTLMTLGVG